VSNTESVTAFTNTLPNGKAVVFTLMIALGGSIPVPLNRIVLVPSLERIVSTEFRGVLLLGVNTTLNEHELLPLELPLPPPELLPLAVIVLIQLP